MLSLYLFLLVLGGGVAGLSLFGDVLDIGSADADALSNPGSGTAEGSGTWWKFFSLIGVVYGALAAGATGTLLHLLWEGERTLFTGALAAGSGITCGVMASLLLSYLQRTGSGEAPAESSFEGLAATVTLPIRESIPGRILVRRGEREYALRALPYPSENSAAGREGGDLTGWKQVVVVEVREGIAYVTPAGQELENASP